jgi:hypothetical protein
MEMRRGIVRHVEEVTLPRTTLQGFATAIADLLSRVRVSKLTVDQSGKATLERLEYEGEAPSPEEAAMINQLRNPYEHWRASTVPVQLPDRSSLLEAALYSLRWCDSAGLIPYLFLVQHNPYPSDQTLLGVRILRQQEVEPGRLILLAGIDLEESFPASNHSALTYYGDPK